MASETLAETADVRVVLGTVLGSPGGLSGFLIPLELEFPAVLPDDGLSVTGVIGTRVNWD